MLCVSELAEATEEVRNAKPPLYKVLKADSGYKLDKPEVAELGLDTICYPDSEGFKLPGKIEGEAAELADCVIRIFDYFGKQGWDMEEVIRLKHEYNLTRPYRHGGKTA